jgi:carbon storage regulator
MLVLSRRKDESILIGDDVVIGVADIRKSQVKLTIDAPRHVPIYRSELCERTADRAPPTRAARSARSPGGGIRNASFPHDASSRLSFP